MKAFVPSDKVPYPGLNFTFYFSWGITFFNLKYPVQEINQREVGNVLRIGISMSLQPLNPSKIL